MKTLCMILAVSVLCGMLALPAAAKAANDDPPKVLVVYYSKSGNTRAIAEMIQAKSNGDILFTQSKRLCPIPGKGPPPPTYPKQSGKVAICPHLKKFCRISTPTT